MGGSSSEDPEKPAASGVLEGGEGAPPPIPPAEMPKEELVRLIDEGNVQAVEAALRERNVRLPAVLDELDRVLGLGLGNLAAVLVTMLIVSFHIARADKLAERVLEHADAAGSEELLDLAAALFMQERLTIANRVLDAVLARGEPDQGRGLYLRARILARRGRAVDAFETIAKASPKLLGPSGMAVQARYALLAGRAKAAEGALKIARKAHSDEIKRSVREVEEMRHRFENAAPELLERASTDLRAITALEYGSLLVELAADPTDGCRFGMDPIAVRDAGRLVERMLSAISQAGLTIAECLYANEDGEIVAAAIAKKTGAPHREWRPDRAPLDGAWLCMASAATHPHLPAAAVHTIQEALDEGTLRTLALVLPSGWRGPLVPDVIGRITGDDELPWAIDDEVEDVVGEMFDEAGDLSVGLTKDDEGAIAEHVARAKPLLRATQPLPRSGHIPFFDETPIPRG